MRINKGLYRPLKAIETRYKGCRFRSRLEARWAVYFDEAGIQWEYEPEGFELPAGRYLPDFFLPFVSMRSDNDGIFAEIKPIYPDDSEAIKCRELAILSGKSLVLLTGSSFRLGDGGFEGFEFGSGGEWDNCMAFYKCSACGHVKVEYCESNYMECPRCDAIFTGNELNTAVTAARSARFEHGESGAV